MQRIVVLALFFLLQLSPALAELRIVPRLLVGTGFNDNIDQVDVDRLQSALVVLEPGIGCSSYITPDLFIGAEFRYSGYSFTENGFGSLTSHILSARIEYTSSPGLMVGCDIAGTLFDDSSLPLNNYSQVALTPLVTWQLDAGSQITFTSRMSHIHYSTTGEGLFEIRSGGYLSKSFTPWFAGSAGVYYLGVDSSSSISDSSGFEYAVGALFSLPYRVDLALSYALNLQSYPDWDTGRNDTTHTSGAELSCELYRNYRVYGGFLSTSRISDYDGCSFDNGSFFAGIIWELPMGVPYPGQAASYEAFLLESAQQYLDADNYQAAEKQLLKLLAQNPVSTDALFWTGYLYHSQKLFVKAVTYFQQVIGLDSSYTEAYYLLGYDYIHLQEKAKAREILTELYNKTGDSDIEAILSTL